ncbi:MAG: DUF6778 family protein [Paracoccaceae bacterium]
MKMMQPGLLCGAVLLLAACGFNEPASRGLADPVPLNLAGPAATAQAEAETVLALPRFAVRSIQVRAPRELSVSEANSYKPRADIVWRGDAFGNRHAQVEAIALAGASLGTEEMQAGVPVDLEIELRRFHALTEKARYSAPFGTEFEFEAIVTLRDAETGAMIGAPRYVKRDFPAASGREALAEEARGITQKTVITQNFGQMIREELSRPIWMTAEEFAALSAVPAPESPAL